jgi:hypothetical protein
MEKRMKDMERRIMESSSGSMNISMDPTVSLTAGGSGRKESHHTSTNMDYTTFGKLDGKLQVTMKKLVEEHRQHSDELRRQIKLQKDSFEKEKIMMQKEHVTLLSNIKCYKKEIHILKHERESIREKLRREKKESQLQEERLKDEVMTVRKEYEMKVKLDSQKSVRTVSDLQKKINISERRIKEMEIKFRDEVSIMEKKYSQERLNLEAKLRETENQVKSRLEFHYQAKLNTERERYENTLRELRKEVKCLQAQRKEIQLKLSNDVSGSNVTTQKDTSYSAAFQNNSFHKRLEREIETRFVQEKRALEDTIRDLQKEVDELKEEKSDAKSCYKEEKNQMEDHFEREKRRIEEKNRNDIDELKRTIGMLQEDNVKFMTMQGGVSKRVFATTL